MNALVNQMFDKVKSADCFWIGVMVLTIVTLLWLNAAWTRWINRK